MQMLCLAVQGRLHLAQVWYDQQWRMAILRPRPREYHFFRALSFEVKDSNDHAAAPPPFERHGPSIICEINMIWFQLWIILSTGTE